MILPTKHLPLEKSALGSGALILRALSRPLTVSELWHRTRGTQGVATFDQLVLGLDFLYALSAIDIADGRIVRRGRGR